MKDRIASNYFSGSYYNGIQDENGICYADASVFGLTVNECFTDGMMKDIVVINMEEGTRYKLQSTQGSNNTLVFKYDGQEFNPRNVYLIDNRSTSSTSETLAVTAEATSCITCYTASGHTTTITFKSLLADGSQGNTDTAILDIRGSQNYDKQVIWVTGSDGAAVTLLIEWTSTSSTQIPLLTAVTLNLNTVLIYQDGAVQQSDLSL